MPSKRSNAVGIAKAKIRSKCFGETVRVSRRMSKPGVKQSIDRKRFGPRSSELLKFPTIQANIVVTIGIKASIIYRDHIATIWRTALSSSATLTLQKKKAMYASEGKYRTATQPNKARFKCCVKKSVRTTAWEAYIAKYAIPPTETRNPDLAMSRSV